MKQIVLFRENEKVIYLGEVVCVDDKALDQLKDEVFKNFIAKEKENAELKQEILELKARLLKVENELAYNRGDIETLEGDK